MGRLGIWYLEVHNRPIIPSFQYPKVPSRWVVLMSGTCKYRTDGSFHHFSTGKHHADGSSRYLVPGSTEQTDHSIISVPASTEQMGRLRIWYLRVPSRWIISSFQYPQVPSSWVDSVPRTWKYGVNGSFHHFSARTYRADGSSRYLVPVCLLYTSPSPRD